MFPVIIFYVGFGVKFWSYIMVFIFFLTSKQPLFFSFIIERKGLQKLILQEFFYSVVQPSLKDYAKYITSLLLCVFFFFLFPFLSFSSFIKWYQTSSLNPLQMQLNWIWLTSLKLLHELHTFLASIWFCFFYGWK